jgi:hypothetical protein
VSAVNSWSRGVGTIYFSSHSSSWGFYGLLFMRVYPSGTALWFDTSYVSSWLVLCTWLATQVVGSSSTTCYFVRCTVTSSCRPFQAAENLILRLNDLQSRSSPMRGFGGLVSLFSVFRLGSPATFPALACAWGEGGGVRDRTATPRSNGTSSEQIVSVSFGFPLHAAVCTPTRHAARHRESTIQLQPCATLTRNDAPANSKTGPMMRKQLGQE